MTITTIQKLIKIGTSRGVTLPAKDLKALNVKDGDELEVVVRKKTTAANDADALEAANALLNRYTQDFTNLSKR